MMYKQDHFPLSYKSFKPFSVLSCLLSSQTGLLVACYQGYVDVVIALSQCPHLDVNWQDSEGNTALITATQAGSVHTRGDTQQRWQRLMLSGCSARVRAAVERCEPETIL